VDSTGATARFNAPSGVALDAAGTGLLIADTANHRIRLAVASSGVVTTYAGDGVAGFIDGPTARFSSPSGISTAAGVAYVTEVGNHAVRKVFFADQSVMTVTGTSASGLTNAVGVHAEFSSPRGLAARNGYIFVADEGNAIVRLVAPSGLVGVAQAGFNAPAAVALSGNGKIAFVADTAASCIWIYALPNTDTASLTASPAPTPSKTVSLAGTASAALLPTGSVPQTASKSSTVTPPPTVTPEAAASVSASSSVSHQATGAPVATTLGTTATPQTTAAPGTTATAASPTPATTDVPATSAAPSTTNVPATSAAPAVTTTAPTLTSTAALINVSYAVSAKYTATVSVFMADSAATATSLVVVAYTDVTASGVGYVTTSSDSTCSVKGSNRSVTCTRASIGAAATPAVWTFSLKVAAPKYARKDVLIRVHVSAADARGTERVLQLALGSTPAPASPTSAAPDTASESVARGAAVRSVFTLDGGCSTPKQPILPLTVGAFVVLLVVRVLLRVTAKAGPLRETATYDVAAAIALPREHIWLGAIAPCHRGCGPIHAVLLFTHVLLLMAFASTCLLLYPHSVMADMTTNAVFAVFSAMAATALRPLLDAFFSKYAIVDKRDSLSYRADKYRPMDLDNCGVERQRGVGLRKSTMTAIASVPYIVDSEEEQPEATAVGAAVTRKPQRDENIGVMILTKNMATIGFVVAAVVATVALFGTWMNTAPWCGTLNTAYELLLLSAIIVDVAVAQPLFVLAVWLWRWMASEEADGRALHELHPINGQWRVVGALYDDADASDSDDGAEPDNAANTAASKEEPAEGNMWVDVDEL
jgi:hypothetical protein